jgi:hypothetical protein
VSVNQAFSDQLCFGFTGWGNPPRAPAFEVVCAKRCICNVMLGGVAKSLAESRSVEYDLSEKSGNWMRGEVKKVGGTGKKWSKVK